MTIDIADISESNYPPSFIIESERLGQLGFRGLYGIDYPYLMFRTAPRSDEDVAGELMVRMGWRMEGREWLTDAQREALTRSDMEAFCESLIEHEPATFGGTPRNEGEGALAYVRRAGGEAVKARWEPFTKNVLLDTQESIARQLKFVGTQSAWAMARNMDAASHMRSLLREEQPELALPYIAPNPVRDTNTILTRVEDQISSLADLSRASAALQSTLNDCVQSGVAEMQVGSERTERSARVALWVGVMGVVAGVMGVAVALGTWAWTADQQGKAEALMAANAKTSAEERQSDRQILRQQLEVARENTEALSKLLGRPATRADN